LASVRDERDELRKTVQELRATMANVAEEAREEAILNAAAEATEKVTLGLLAPIKIYLHLWKI
jgi:predicted nucleotidyltransferase